MVGLARNEHWRPFGIGAVVAALVAFALPRIASAALIESFEDTLDGWQVPPSYNLQPSFGASTSFSNTTGVTDGSWSLEVTGTGGSGPNYSQLMESPTTMSNTTILGDAQSISWDVYTPPGSFGYYLQWDVDINNADTGFQSLDGYSYQAVNIGSETTLTVNIPSSIQETLAASSNPTSIDFQVGGGYTAGNESFYIDNIRTTAIVPEPASLGTLGAGLAMLLIRRRRQA